MDLVTTMLPLALVVGLSPLPILPAIMLLMTPNARANGAAYLAAWLVALTLLVAAMAWIGGLTDPDPATEEGVGWIKVVTGVLFLAMAAMKWARRPGAGQPKDPPGWMAALDSYTPRQSARLGALLAGGNPKNLAMALAAGAEIALLASGPGATAAGVASFVAVGSIGVATPILGHALLGERATPGLQRAKGWLERNSTALSVGVLVLLGVGLVLGGLPSAV